MRGVVQRVAWARVTVEGEVVGRCGQGLLVLVGAHKDDSDDQARVLADRVAQIRIFGDDEGKMNLALGALPPSDEPRVLAISNFTLYGDAMRQRRPSFIAAAPYERGKQLFDLFVDSLRGMGVPIETGSFGAHMNVESMGDGPVTVVIDC